MNNKDIQTDETPSTTAWKKACQMMYLEEGKVSYFFDQPTLLKVKDGKPVNSSVSSNKTLNNTLNLVHRFSHKTYMYTECLLFQLQDVDSFEPMLQAALLPKDTWLLLAEIGRIFDNGTLEGFKKEKPSRNKKWQLTQNQVQHELRTKR